MKRIAFIVALLVGTAFGQSTTITGTLKDLSGANVTSGKVTFTLTPSRDTTISGLARFSPQTVTCVINGSGLIKALDGVSVCTITQNTALQPPGSYYVVGVWPANVKTSTFTFYAVLSSYDWSTVVPTPTTSPAQNFVDIFSNQTIGGNKIWSGTHVFNGSVSFPGGISGNVGPLSVSSLNGIQVVDSSTAGSDASCKLATAIGALGTSGGLIFAQTLTDVGGLGACVVDPGSKIVTIYLGPYTYVMRLKLRTNFHVFGFGAFSTGTQILAPDTTNDVISLGGGNFPVAGVVLDGFRVHCGAGNTTQKGINIVAATNGGLWYSDFRNVIVGEGDGSTGVCGGGAWIFDANIGGSPSGVNQFLRFSNVGGFRKTNSGNPALLITGFNGQFSFDGASQFDGPTVHDTNQTNVIITGGTQTVLAPYTIIFTDVTMQHAWGASGVALQLQGTTGFVCHGCHFEDDNGGVNLVVGSTFGNWGAVIESSFFATGTGIDGGNGWIVKMDSSSSLAFDSNQIFGTPDAFTLGNTQNFESRMNVNFNSGALYGTPFNNTIAGGFNNNGSGFKHKRTTGCTTGATSGNTCTTTVTWTTAFPDANYTPSCTLLGTATLGHLAAISTDVIAAASVKVETVTDTNAAITGTINCIAVHD